MIGSDGYWPLTLLEIVKNIYEVLSYSVDLKATRQLQNPLSTTVAGKFQASGGHINCNRLQDPDNFHMYHAWQIVLIFNNRMCFLITLLEKIFLLAGTQAFNLHQVSVKATVKIDVVSHVYLAVIDLCVGLVKGSYQEEYLYYAKYFVSKNLIWYSYMICETKVECLFCHMLVFITVCLVHLLSVLISVLKHERVFWCLERSFRFNS